MKALLMMIAVSVSAQAFATVDICCQAGFYDLRLGKTPLYKRMACMPALLNGDKAPATLAHQAAVKMVREEYYAKNPGKKYMDNEQIVGRATIRVSAEGKKESCIVVLDQE